MKLLEFVGLVMAGKKLREPDPNDAGEMVVRISRKDTDKGNLGFVRVSKKDSQGREQLLDES